MSVLVWPEAVRRGSWAKLALGLPLARPGPGAGVLVLSVSVISDWPGIRGRVTRTVALLLVGALRFPARRPAEFGDMSDFMSEVVVSDCGLRALGLSVARPGPGAGS
jgi:hypothetical protein